MLRDRSRGIWRQAVMASTLFGLFSAIPAQGEEGMWLPDQVPALGPRLKALGLELDPAKLADLAQGPAAAVVDTMGGTSSFVSSDGLMLTNHHVAFDAIQANSDAQHDYIENGFVAGSRDKELPAPGYRILVNRGMEDVTQKVLGAIPQGADDMARQKAVDLQIKQLVAECEKTEGLRCSVSSMLWGQKYYLVSTLELKDIRLVYAPSQRIGAFGGEVDNFAWPRHTGDFSFMRAYVGPDGKPAAYSPQNQPYHPPVFLKPASTPLEEGDLAMTWGFPGYTARYVTAKQMQYQVEYYLPDAVNHLKWRIATIDEFSKTSRERAIRLLGEREIWANTLKNLEGKLVGLRKLKALDARRAMEKELVAWLEADPARKAQHGDVLPTLDALTQEAMDRHAYRMGLRRLSRGGAMMEQAMFLVMAARERAKPDMERKPWFMERNLAQVRQSQELVQKDLDLELSRAFFEQAIRDIMKLKPESRPAPVAAQFAANSPEELEKVLKKTLDKWMKTTRLGDLAYRLELLDGGEKAVAASKDPFVVLARELEPMTLKVEQEGKINEGKVLQLGPRWIALLQAWQPERLFYPDANSTLRLSYGTVKGYSSGDAVSYAAFTTLNGVLEKERGEFPFNAPEALLKAAPGNERLPVNFLTTNDTTGGNSGSPLLNGKGELVGLLFDGNIESTVDDLVFWKERNRSINVDLRYIAWVATQVDKATAVMDELKWNLPAVAGGCGCGGCDMQAKADCGKGGCDMAKGGCDMAKGGCDKGGCDMAKGGCDTAKGGCDTAKGGCDKGGCDMAKGDCAGQKHDCAKAGCDKAKGGCPMKAEGKPAAKPAGKAPAGKASPR